MYRYFDKGNCVMLAYILVLYALPSIKGYCDKNCIEFPMWSQIVLAVTISSYLFIFANWLKGLADYMEKSMLKLINIKNQYCSSFRMMILALEVSECKEVKDLRNDFYSEFSRMIDDIDDETYIHRIKSVINIVKNIESIFNFISFLALFVYSMGIDKIATFLKISDTSLESLTVSGFGLMLFFLLLEDVLIRWFNEKNSEIENKVKIVSEDIEVIIKKLKSISEKVRTLECDHL